MDNTLNAYHMSMFEDTAQYLFDRPPELDFGDDILAQYSPADFLAFDNPTTDLNQRDSVGSVPDITFSPPTRSNTVHIKDQETGIEDNLLENDYQPWEAPGIGIARAGRGVAQGIVIAGSLSTAPSDAGTSQTSFMDSGFFSSVQKCEQCGAVYKNNSQRRKHILTHTKPHVCQHVECKRHFMGFATPNDLDRHEKSVHKDGLKVWWRCAFLGCQKTSKSHCFDRKDNFIAHIKRRHKDLLTSAIDELVNCSEQHPSLDEVQAAREAKEARPASRRSSSTKGSTKGSTQGSTRGSARESTRNRMRQKIKSKNASMRSHSPPTPIGPPSPSNYVFPSSAPTGHQTKDYKYFGGRDDLAFVGGAAETSGQQATMRPDGKRVTSLQVGLPSMSSNYGAMPNMVTLNMDRTPPQATVPRQFQSYLSEQSNAGWSFDSSTFNQMIFQNSQPAVRGLSGQTQSNTTSFQSVQSDFSPVSPDASFQNNMFSAGAMPDTIFNQGHYQQTVSPTSTFESQSQYNAWQDSTSSPLLDMQSLSFDGDASFCYPNPLDEG